MEIAAREGWSIIHGMGFGAVFLLSFAGGLAGLYSLRPDWLTVEGIQERLLRLKVGMWTMTVAVWATVFTGTYIVYPWYRANPPAGAGGRGGQQRSRTYRSRAHHCGGHIAGRRIYSGCRHLPTYWI